jgi:hypothetical protein
MNPVVYKPSAIMYENRIKDLLQDLHKKIISETENKQYANNWIDEWLEQTSYTKLNSVNENPSMKKNEFLMDFEFYMK